MGLVEGLNGSGVALTANAKATEAAHNIGHILTLVSLCIQVVVILSFFTLSIMFHRRCIRAKVLPRAVRAPIVVLYCSMTLIFVRCIYRLVEFTTGSTSINLSDYNALLALSPLLRYEVYFYIFEASLILLNSVLWNIYHAGRYLPRDKAVFLAQDGRTEMIADANVSGKQDSSLSGLANFGAVGLIMKIVKALQKKPHGHRRIDSETQELNDMRAISGDRANQEDARARSARHYHN